MTPSYFLIGSDGRRYGPITADDVLTFVADGRASRYSRVQRHADDQWQPLGDMPEFAEATRPRHLIDADAGVAPLAEEAVEPGVEESTRLDPVRCFRRAWALVTADFVTLGGWTMIATILVMATGLIPRVGWPASLIVNNLLMAGLYLLYLARIRGQRTTVAAIVNIVRFTSINIVVAGAAQIALTVVGLLLLILPGIYLAVGYAFVLPLVVDKQLPVWQAMELSRTTVHRHWRQMFVLMLVSGVLIVLAALPFGAGLVLALPLCTAALMFAYEDLFGAP